ncbi:DUF1707 SHOCT-like domain-containing protein [Streptomyces acidiscabies]|uniref:DUF1707 domain-containing protein n=1 Tax=Streptomyces acidiscabies TaxID=42234 RepID=A0AAP6BDW5_9ACTN|nr:DUF1707 domain-containing protein [Streptomyces acidiscabies]MBP5941829.1 DUF1707 domain-containing protein [Streptomyces sp. LBUM 1476]MBZ3913259.1 DUF1707 domain-containing protein [Streptomyces acidiscabies]MDX2962955.1 DUF1707 domain-containing protein [Streptomyces acidiscabies]MDX3021466.1 DUF1707 domain-containing protein [Streptomyces acidiscabies]MDX3790224.1 DUF1707 domain-containing protein [Streptomyces acidiscabies]
MPEEITATGKLRASHADRDHVVDVLRISAGDGRLTSAELDERIELALSARTMDDLTVLTADLPPVSTSSGTAVAEVKDVLRIEQTFSKVERVGRWVVPRRLELATQWCDVTLDFTQAEITQPTLHIDMAVYGKTLTLITRPGIVVDADALRVQHAKVKYRRRDDSTPTALRIELTGDKAFGRVMIRPARRSLGQWLLRRSPGR